MRKQTAFEETRRNKHKKGMAKSQIVIIIVAIILLVGAGGGIGFYLYSSGQKTEVAKENTKEADPDKIQNQYDKLKSTVAVDADDPMLRKVDFAAAQAENSDIYAWIWIPGTNVDYPILRSETEEDAYYLNHTIDRSEGLPGTIYVEKYNAKDFSDPVTVVYGHNMKNGSMFADLHKYEDQEFFNNNPYIYIYLPDQTLKYRVFAAVTFDDRYLLGNYNFTYPEDFQKYLDELKSSMDGHVNAEVNVTQETGILTLSTCIGDSPSQRWMVNATKE